MIKLKDLLLENEAPDIFIPRRVEDRVERLIKQYIRNGSKGDLDLSGLNLNELPEILKNVNVGGNFFCDNNKLTSLTNAPKFVGGTFICSRNSLNSLTGAPTSVVISFYCRNNNLTSLEFAPTSVGRNFDCTNNDLTSLEFAPKTVNGHFFCYQNPVKFTEKQVRSVSDVKGMVGV
jgi:hypothetical protein